MCKDVKQLTVDDFVAHPLWRFLNDDDLGETAVESVDNWPLANLDGLVIGSTVTTSCGKTFPAIFF